MKIKLSGIFLIMSIMIFGCRGGGAPQGNDFKGIQINTSGKVEGGYRHIPINVGGEPIDLTVYRGDYVKFFINDDGNARSEYEFLIPELNIQTILRDNSSEQPYFKMKKTGKYRLKIGEQMGVIHVVELEQVNYSEISAEEAWKMINKNPPFILDVRTKREFSNGYIRGAKLIPLQELQQRSNEIEMYQNQAILIYCATGNRSTTASKILLDRGFKNIMNLRMGIMGWGSQGYGVEF